MIVVGTDDPSTSASTQLLIFGYSEETRYLIRYSERSRIFSVCMWQCRKWQKIHSVVGIVYDPVHDVAFAPNLGRYTHCPSGSLMTSLSLRSYHVLAVASKDVDIIHLVPSGYVSQWRLIIANSKGPPKFVLCNRSSY